jgi:hypothetical protein
LGVLLVGLCGCETTGGVRRLGKLHGVLAHDGNAPGGEVLAGAVPGVRNRAEVDLPPAVEDHPQVQGKVKVDPLPLGRWWVD